MSMISCHSSLHTCVVRCYTFLSRNRFTITLQPHDKKPYLVKGDGKLGIMKKNDITTTSTTTTTTTLTTSVSVATTTESTSAPFRYNYNSNSTINQYSSELPSTSSGQSHAYSHFPSTTGALPLNHILPYNQNNQWSIAAIRRTLTNVTKNSLLVSLSMGAPCSSMSSSAMQSPFTSTPIIMLNHTDDALSTPGPSLLYVAPLLPTSPLKSPPVPPNWNDHLENTKISLCAYKLFPLSSESLEFATIAKMLNPVQVTSAEQIVNPLLWSRFVNARKEMLLSKSDDLQLLSKLGLDEEEITRRAHFSFNFTTDPSVTAYPYSDNMALLFHSINSSADVDVNNILQTGLDERIDKAGRFGRGIYFSDDPHQFMQNDGYAGTIFIVAVLLGDCLSVDSVKNKETFVREPEKLPLQKRNFNDLNFDSIFERQTVYNEYVIYNRYQCCPLYKLHYTRSSTGKNYNGNQLPPFSWVRADGCDYAMPNQFATKTGWAFYARNIFALMGVHEAVEMPIKCDESIDEKLAVILSLGFSDVDLNLETLKKFEFDLDKSVSYLLDQGRDIKDSSESEPSSLSEASNDWSD